MERKKSFNASDNQKKMLVEYLKKHPELLSGKFTNTFTLKDAVRKWQEITEILNSVPGARKEWKSWRKVCNIYIYNTL